MFLCGAKLSTARVRGRRFPLTCLKRAAPSSLTVLNDRRLRATGLSVVPVKKMSDLHLQVSRHNCAGAWRRLKDLMRCPDSGWRHDARERQGFAGLAVTSP